MASKNGSANAARAQELKQEGFTATERRLLAVLEDGHAHPATQLMRELNDDLTAKTTLVMHISNLRGKLKARGEDIGSFNDIDRVLFYQIRRRIAK